MKAYDTIKFTEAPDVGDIRNEGRASHVGKFGERGYVSSASKKATRRYLKRSDRARSIRLHNEGEDV
jgi:hypothetical protein